MESGLNFNQLICEFESRRPCQFFLHVILNSIKESYRTFGVYRIIR